MLKTKWHFFRLSVQLRHKIAKAHNRFMETERKLHEQIRMSDQTGKKQETIYRMILH